MSEMQRQAERLADRLLADLKSGALAKVGLDEIEAATAALVAQGMDAGLYRGIVNWTVRFLVDKAAK